MRRLLLVCVFLFSSTLFVSAAYASSISGKVLDPTGAVVPGAQITVTSARITRAVATTADGTFRVPDLPPGSYVVTVSKPGFAAFHQQDVRLRSGENLPLTLTISLSSVQQSVEVRGTRVTAATHVPTQEQVFKSDQTLRVLDSTQIAALGPVAGAGQIVSLTPGANVTGYGNTGATKTTIAVNGVHQGWGGYGGLTDSGSLAVTFDGIPVSDPATDLWQSNTLPQKSLIQNANVTYGPGDAASRNYNNIGGSVEFTPIQPAAKPGGDFSVTYGRFAQKNYAFTLDSGNRNGWSAVAGGGGGSGNSFRQGIGDNFGNPSRDYAFYGKVLKSLGGLGSFSGGGYFAHSEGYRAQVIPTTNQGITVDAQPGSQVYSQATSGFYSTLPYASYNKDDTNVMGLGYGRERFVLNSRTMFENTTWYMHIRRLHNRLNDVYSTGPQQNEYNNPHTNTVGDKAELTEDLPHNTLREGLSYIHALYNSRNNFYNAAYGGATNVVNIGGKIRSGYFHINDVALYAQDQIELSPRIDITPGVRVVRYSTSYDNGALQDFTFAPGVVLSTHCPITLVKTSGNTTDQGAVCTDSESPGGVEPSVNMTAEAAPWLTLYGGYSGALKTPQVGGGGGPFQKVDPRTFHFAKQHYYQAGFKVHPNGQGPLSTLLFGAAYYHENYDDQEIDIDLATGGTIQANGSSAYDGVNMYLDDSPASAVHLYANLSVEKANYSNYVTGGVSYNGSPVPYVPSSMFNVGAYFDVKASDSVEIEPTASFQFTGAQHLFDNTTGAPSPQTMSAFGTVNLGVKVPFRYVDFSVAMLNVLNKQYNQYEYISSGGYFGTANGGYILAYPGAPFTAYAEVGFHF
ncbi:MAG: TonB-dependent receptor [Acidobacteriota bacterium]|nr:TonB-dependent receptor [Acidobacteriota bacterium]